MCSRWATFKDEMSRSSITAASLFLSVGRDFVASSNSSKMSKLVADFDNKGKVLKVASAIKARVPSLPTIKWVKISIGFSKSTNELRP